MPDANNNADRIAFDRRTYLKKSTLAGSAIAAGSFVVPQRLASRAFAAGTETIKVGLIGCGGRGAGAAAQALSTGMDVKLWAMADAFTDRLELSLSSLSRGQAGKSKVEPGQGFGGAIDVPPERRFIGLDAYRKLIDCGVDVVILTGPPGFRPQQFEYAVNAGKHVFMEKPVASDAHGVRRILESAKLAKEKNLKVGVGLQRHHQDDVPRSGPTDSRRTDRSHHVDAMLLEWWSAR